jgi:hypothetical protein
MAVFVDLTWEDGDPSLTAIEIEGGLRVVVDVRLSEHQVETACADLADGPAVQSAWRARVGLSERQPAS